MTLDNGLPVSIDGNWKSEEDFSWFAFHIDVEGGTVKTYCFGENDLGASDNKKINRAVINYCLNEAKLNEVEGKAEGKKVEVND
ncbi:MAG: hypothetical protein PHQ35_11470 [Phycisphaerae bacterium]|nr:hypothetical protein [Phycisphaerae bacterium]